MICQATLMLYDFLHYQIYHQQFHMKILLPRYLDNLYNGNFFRLSHCYKGEYYFSDSHDNKTNAYSIDNLSFGRNFKNISLSIWVNNLFDKRYPVRGFYFGLLPPDYEDQLWISYGDPFQAGVSIDYSY